MPLPSDEYADIVAELEALQIVQDLEDRQEAERKAREHLSPVTSSWIDAYSYDPLAHTLYVRFHDKRGHVTVTCRYDEVTEDLWEGFLAAPSKGEYFHASGLIRWPYEVI